jgi:hypothetical protein
MEINRDEFNALNASRKAERERIAAQLIEIAAKHGASVEKIHSEATRGYCGQGIDLRFACKGVGAMVDVDDLHGGSWVLISWFNDTHPARNFTARFCTVVGDHGQTRRHHKSTSHPRDWYSLAMMLDGGLMLAARGEAFEARASAT